jgi:hypothetical protein
MGLCGATTQVPTADTCAPFVQAGLRDAIAKARSRRRAQGLLATMTAARLRADLEEAAADGGSGLVRSQLRALGHCGGKHLQRTNEPGSVGNFEKPESSAYSELGY